MPGLKPISRRDLIIRLCQLGFVGPFAGKRHEYMERGHFKLRIPNPHQGDIGIPLWLKSYWKPKFLEKTGKMRRSFQLNHHKNWNHRTICNRSITLD